MPIIHIDTAESCITTLYTQTGGVWCGCRKKARVSEPTHILQSLEGPIGPGGAYEFSFTAKPGMRLSLALMFGQSNDWFYAPKRQGIDLFTNGKALSGDITSELMLFDAGTEVDEEPGVGPNQGPRQKTPDAGTPENGKVHAVKTTVFAAKNGDLFRVTITPETMASAQ